jgi:hypothetical protein
MNTRDPDPFYVANADHYPSISYQLCGNKGWQRLRLPRGLWQNLTVLNALKNTITMLHRAFYLRITYFDLTNNYAWPCDPAKATLAGR